MKRISYKSETNWNAETHASDRRGQKGKLGRENCWRFLVLWVESGIAYRTERKTRI